MSQLRRDGNKRSWLRKRLRLRRPRLGEMPITISIGIVGNNKCEEEIK